MKYLWLLLLVACAPLEVPVIYLPPEMMGENAGITACTDNHFVIIAVNGVFKGQPAEEQILAHEYVHVRQLARIGGCRSAKQAFIQDPTLKARNELEAYCHDVARLRLRHENYRELQDALKAEFPVRFGIPFECKEARYGKILVRPDSMPQR